MTPADSDVTEKLARVRGWLAGPAPGARPAGLEGCDYDFLRVTSAADLPFVEPVIGRS
jgi:hypothetical protein